MNNNLVSLILRILIIAIFGQTLFFKFSGAEESIYIFSKLGVEPWGRIGSGIFELITSILIIFPSTKIYGIAMSVFIITGAIVSHIFFIGIEVKGDGGLLFYLALFILIMSLLLLFLHAAEVKEFIRKILKFKLFKKIRQDTTK